MTLATLPFGPNGMQLYCTVHRRAWCASADPDKLTQGGDTLDLTEPYFGSDEIDCICEFEHCPFLHEMPVGKDGFVLPPSEWVDT